MSTYAASKHVQPGKFDENAYNLYAGFVVVMHRLRLRSNNPDWQNIMHSFHKVQSRYAGSSFTSHRGTPSGSSDGDKVLSSGS